MTRVLLDATPLDTGHARRGIGRYVQGLLEGFRSIEPSAIAPELLALPNRKEDRFRVHPYARRAVEWASLMAIENRLRIDQIIPEGIDLYHATSMEGASRRVPFVATCHDLIPLLLRGPYLPRASLTARWFWHDYITRLRRDARVVIAISDHVRTCLTHRFEVRADKVVVVHHGVSPFWSALDPTHEPPSAARAAAERPFVIYVGGYDVRKRVGSLIDAVAAVDASHRPRVVLVGSTAGDAARRLIAEVAARSAVDLTSLDYVSDRDLRWLYRRALCLGFTSIEEGWGFPIVEAMAAGTAVVCAPYGAMSEAAGGAALTADPNDIRAFSDAIGRLALNPSLQSDLAAKGLERVQPLTWARTANATRSAYEQALR